jgi:hypothetical protein
MNVTKKISELESELTNLKQQEKQINSRKKFLCACNKMHSIRECGVIQTHWYVPPRGCSEGDYYNEGELQIVCPTTGTRNRVLFNIPYSLRDSFDYNPETKFKNKYKSLFNTMIDEYEEKRNHSFVNNYYFDEHRKKFDIEVIENE